MKIYVITLFVFFVISPFFLNLSEKGYDERKVIALCLGTNSLVLLPLFLLFLKGSSLIIGIGLFLLLVIVSLTLFYDLELKAKELYRYLFIRKDLRFYQDYQKNRTREVLENYDEIQTMISYVVENEINNVEYASYIAQLYYGYYNNTSVIVPHSYVSQILQNYVVRNGLRLSLEIPFDIDKYDTDEIEILVTKYKTSIDIIRSMIGKELNEETKQRIEDIWQSFAEDLEKGIEEVQKVKEMIKKQEHEAYELEQKRLQELLENEINWLRSDK